MAGHSASPTGRARLYLDVAFTEKDAAKALGARWDPSAKRWYDPKPPTPGLDRWTARPPIPDVLPGEDRTFGDGLFVDLIPRTCWFTNVRTCVSEQDWERLRRPIFRRAGHVCEACGAAEDRVTRRWLEAHERWHFDQLAGVQSLRRLISLCSPCHLVTHFGYANVTGRTEEALAHLRQVRGFTLPEALAHVHAAEDVWIERSSRLWELDLSILTDMGITVRRPERAADRPAAAQRALVREPARLAEPLSEVPAAASVPPTPALLSMPVVSPTPRSGLWARLTGRSEA